MPDEGGFDEDVADVVADACRDVDSASCETICRPAECCFVDEDYCTNAGLEALDCGHYDACYEYYDARSGSSASQVLVPRPPPDLELTCSNGRTSVSPEGAQQCADACSVAKCCVANIESCRVVNPSMCLSWEVHCEPIWGDAEYEEVTIPAGDSVTIPYPPAELNEICSVDSVLEADGHDKCQSLCDDALCCYSSVNKCRVLNPDVCSQYDACSVLHSRPSEAAVASKETYSGGIEVPRAPPGLSDLCSAKSMSNVHGFADCEDWCDKARCCLEDSFECTVLNKEACSDYDEPCTNLFEFKTKGSIQSEIGNQDAVDIMDLAEQVVEACNFSSLKEVQGRSHCDHLCNDRSCCFEPAGTPESCAADAEKECLAFASCKILNDNK